LKGASLNRLQIGQDALDRPRPRIATVSKIEDKTRIPNGFSSKTGWSDIAAAQEFLYFSQQMHVPFPHQLNRLGDVLCSNAIPTCLAIIYLANARFPPPF
jgi:hypothetical protein